MISKNFLALSLLLVSSAKAENSCSMVNSCCQEQAECATKTCCSVENCDGCMNCEGTKTVTENNNCNTQEVVTQTRAEVVNEENSQGTQCIPCIKHETESMSTQVATLEPAEETEKRVKSAVVLEIANLVSNGFKILGNLSHTYLALSESHKAIFAKTIVEFLFDLQKELRSHQALFTKIGQDYIKSCENLKFTHVKDETKSENENLKAQFLFTADHLSQFYIDLANIYKTLTIDEQNELASLFVDVYSKQKEVCHENAPVLTHIAESLKHALQPN